MKFVVIFVVCCVALAAANDEQPTAEELKFIQLFFEKAVEELEATCANHKTACNNYMAKRFTNVSDEKKKNISTEACLVLIEQYLCQGKKDREGLIDLAKQSKKFNEQLLD